MSGKKKPPKYRLRYTLPAGKPQPVRRVSINIKTGEVQELEPTETYTPPEYEELSLVEAEKARLRAMARMLEHPASTPEMQERGEALLEDLARLLAEARTAKIGSAIGTKKRREAGERKATAVERAIAAGADPLTVTSDRNLRRIKIRKKR